MATYMSVRLTPHEDDEALSKMQGVLGGKYGGSYMLVREYSKEGVEHYHGIVAISGKPKQFQDAIVRAFKESGSRGNKYYQSKNCTNDVQAAMQYICKGSSEHPNPRGDPPDVVGLTGMYFTEEKVKELHDKYWEQSKKVKDSKKLSFPTRVEHYMKLNDKKMTKEGCVSAVVEMTLEEKKPINEYYMLGVAKYILCKNDRQAKRALKQSLLDKWNGSSYERTTVDECGITASNSIACSSIQQGEAEDEGSFAIGEEPGCY